MKALVMFALLAAPLYGQGVSMGGHYSSPGEFPGHPMVFWTLEVRSPEVGPFQVAATHSALKYQFDIIDRTDAAVLLSPDWPVRPVLMGGIEVSREWMLGESGPCGETEKTGYPPCEKRWYTGGVYGFGLAADVAGGRVDVRYLRHPGAPAAKGALIALIGMDL